MQIVKYEINKNILIVGFKEDDFVVYSQIGYDETKEKNELLQNAYEQCKTSIKYEKLQLIHSNASDDIGEEFVPEDPKPVTLMISFDLLTGLVIDQYGDVYSTDIIFSIEGTDKVTISNGIIHEQPVDIDMNYYIVATYNNLVKKENRNVLATIPIDIKELRQNKILEMSTICEDRIINNFYSSCLGVDHQFDCDRDSQLYMQGLISKASLITISTALGLPVSDSNLDWKFTGEPICYAWTAPQVIVLGEDLYTHLSSCKKQFEKLREYLNNEIRTVEELNLVTWDMIINL